MRKIKPVNLFCISAGTGRRTSDGGGGSRRLRGEVVVAAEVPVGLEGWWWRRCP